MGETRHRDQVIVDRGLGVGGNAVSNLPGAVQRNGIPRSGDLRCEREYRKNEGNENWRNNGQGTPLLEASLQLWIVYVSVEIVLSNSLWASTLM